MTFPVDPSHLQLSLFSCAAAGDNLPLLSPVSLVPTPMRGTFAVLAVFLHFNISHQTLDPDRILVVRE